MTRKLRVMVSAMLVGVQLGRAVAAEPGLDQLAQIEMFLSNNDIPGLRRFLETNPELLAGDTELALLLRRFIAESRNLPAFMTTSDLQNAIAAAAPDPRIDEGSDDGEDPADEADEPVDGDDGPEAPEGEPMY